MVNTSDIDGTTDFIDGRAEVAASGTTLEHPAIDQHRTGARAGVVASMVAVGLLASDPTPVLANCVERPDRPSPRLEQLSRAMPIDSDALNNLLFFMALEKKGIQPGVEIPEEKLFKTLVELLSEGGPVVRLQAINAVGDCKVPGAVEPLSALLKNGSDDEQVAAARALGKLAHRGCSKGKQASEILKAALRHPACQTLACMGLEEAPLPHQKHGQGFCKQLEALLRDPDFASKIDPAAAILIRGEGDSKLQEEAMRQVLKDLDGSRTRPQRRATRLLQSEIGANARGAARVLVEALGDKENANKWANAARGLLEMEPADLDFVRWIVKQAKEHKDPYVLTVVYPGLLRSKFYVKHLQAEYAADARDPRLRRILQEYFARILISDPTAPVDPKLYDALGIRRGK